MRRAAAALGALLAATLLAQAAPARELCTLVVEAEGGRVLHETGPECDERATPASTFKVALAAIGFDAGLLSGPHAPRLSWRPGDPDWAGPAWREDADPTRWLAISVVWYSQRLTHELGSEALGARLRGFDYGNADVSGDPGKDNGLDRAWLLSSLEISPQEQARFLRRLLAGELDLAPRAVEQTLAIVPQHSAGGWLVHGKTGAARAGRAAGPRARLGLVRRLGRAGRPPADLRAPHPGRGRARPPRRPCHARLSARRLAGAGRGFGASLRPSTRRRGGL